MNASSLRELQRAFLAATTNPQAPHPTLDARGLAVHRNNWRSNLCGALRAAYPVVERLVGDEFFIYTAHCFIDSYPSRSANLEDYGAEFAVFLRTFEPAQGLPYLADVASLEMAVEYSMVAADEAVARRLLQSPFPVLRIWQVNQPGWTGDDTVNLDSGPDYLFIHRVDQEVLIEPVDRESFYALLHTNAS